VFPSQKFRWLRDRLLHTRFAAMEDFVTPEPATDDDVRGCTMPRTSTDSVAEPELPGNLRLEIPYSRQMVEAFWLAAGGSILAARLALKDGIGFNIGAVSITHFRRMGRLCAINDIAIAVRRLQADA